ncbi:PREDICTED: probable ADP-ribosylation factor GTPase-activating protein AGD14 [Tarenaya hassleriana]|uniref:probable ADP-ribosylation factor GTPase-activating protein AGD14 n=1 Tax=Tarenaya hassleriana TaxID=28532 RepID=UPI00053C59E7|nr:PREDICTED: probable ADP-ribosylation factor GTPase-activating protein AGD14 [Tarenaya hassleriana]
MWVKNYSSREPDTKVPWRFVHGVHVLLLLHQHLLCTALSAALQAGGNERARQIYFKEWDSQRNACPDGRLREFIKNVYVDRKYSSESNEKALRLRTADKECSDETERMSYERAKADGKNGDGSLKFNIDEKRNTGHIRHHSRASGRGLPKSPIHFEIVDDRFRDDGGGVKRYDGRNSARGQHSKSLDLSSKTDRLSSPVARPIGEVLGDKAPQLQVRKDTVDDPKPNQKSSHKNRVEQKTENPENLMDSQPSDQTSTQVNQQILQSTASDNQASSEIPASQKPNQGPDPNSLEALLFGLSVPSADKNSELCSKTDSFSTAPVSKHSAASLENQMSATQENIDSFAASPPNVPAQPSNAVADNLYTKENAGTDQPRVAPNSPDFEGPSTTSMQQLTLSISTPAQGQSPRVGSELHQEKAKSSGRKELPEDLFTGGFSFASPQVHNWQPGLPHGIGFGLPYYQNPMTMGGYNYNYTSKPTNPFDADNDTTPVRAPQFPSMAFTHGALPHVSAPRGFLNTQSPVAGSLGSMAPHSPSYAAVLSPRSPSFASTLSPGAYMAQQTHMNMLLSPRRHAIDGLNTEGNAFNSASSGYPSANPSPYHSRGNPFG